MKNKRYVSPEYPKECRLCEYGRMSFDGQIVLCMKRGPVEPDSVCRKYTYDPLKRVPRPTAGLQAYSKENFRLD